MISRTPYREVLPRSKIRPLYELDWKPKAQLLSDLLRLHFNVKTWLALGAAIQTCLTLLPIPTRYALAPCLLYLLSRVILTCLINYNVLVNPYLKRALPDKKYTAIIPDRYGNFPAEDEIPTGQKIAIMLLNCKFNHPAGMASAHALELAQHFVRMNKDIYQQQQTQSGCLGYSQAYMPSPEGAIQIVNISYWRSKEHVLRYAESPAHREAVKWWTDLGGFDRNGTIIPHLGISHEVFESEPGKWESMYLNTQPTFLAATSCLKESDAPKEAGAPEEWIHPIVDARRGKLARARDRLDLSVLTQ